MTVGPVALGLPAEPTSRPAVAVVVPANRVDHMLDAALQSLLADPAASLEVVVVLDGLPAEGWRSTVRDERLRVVAASARLGTAGALNLGVAVTTAAFVARLDADDLAVEGRLAAQLDYLGQHPDAVAVGTWARLVDAQGSQVGALRGATGGDVRPQLLRRNELVHSSMMFRRAALERVGGYDERCPRMQDYDLYLRLARHGRIAVIGRDLVEYRVHDQQSSRRSSPWRPSVLRLLARRRSLASDLGRGSLRQWGHDLLWFVYQACRHSGLVRPRYLWRSSLCRGQVTQA